MRFIIAQTIPLKLTEQEHNRNVFTSKTRAHQSVGVRGNRNPFLAALMTADDGDDCDGGQLAQG